MACRPKLASFANIEAIINPQKDKIVMSHLVGEPASHIESNTILIEKDDG
jgi:hypothetical protein